MRSLWKCKYGVNLPKTDTRVKIYKRNIRIQKILLNKIVEVYNGKRFAAFKVTNPMIDHLLGEFAIPNKTGIHKKKINKKHK